MSSYQVVDTERIYEGRIIKVRVDTLSTSQGMTVRREVVEHPGAIVVAAMDDRGRVILVRQWRHAAKQSLLELPAGTLELGEEPRLAAVREMQEETGFYPGELIPVTGFFSAPGFCEEYLHFFVAINLRVQKLQGDEDEDTDDDEDDFVLQHLSKKKKNSNNSKGQLVIVSG